MLTENAIRMFSAVLYTGCNILKFYPYIWDPIAFRLLPAPRSHMFIYNIHRYFQHFCLAFVCYRFATVDNWSLIPDRGRVIHGIWISGHALMFISFAQFQKTKKEIMIFTNSLWAYIIEHRGETVKADLISKCIIAGGFLLYINIPVHGSGMIEIPCTPQFFSSIFFECKTPTDDVEGWLKKIPFFLVDSYILAVFLTVLAFCSAIVFLGLAWIRRELSTIRIHRKEKLAHLDPKCYDYEFTLQHYRTCQRIMNLLNESFGLYLEWFPTMLLGLVSLALFATLTVWHLPIHAYLLFPGCGLRCVLETLTPLAMAGKVNEESSAVLQEWRQRFESEGRKGNRWVKQFHRSCPVIVCTAGSLYTFENSIVLCTLSNCVQLTTNLLLMSRRSARSVSQAFA